MIAKSCIVEPGYDIYSSTRDVSLAHQRRFVDPKPVLSYRALELEPELEEFDLEGPAPHPLFPPQVPPYPPRL